MNKFIAERKTQIASLGITLSILLSSTGYLYFDNKKSKELNEKQKTEIISLNENKSKLAIEISSYKNQLEQYKGKNIELDNLVTTAQNEILVKETKIKKLITDNESLQRVQKEVLELRKSNQRNLTKIQELEETLSFFTTENTNLKNTNNELLGKLEKLEARNTILEKKVEIASVLKVDNIFVIGEKKSKNGKYVPAKVKKADRLFVTFDLLENKIAEEGEKTLYIRVLDSKGKLVENGESGSFPNIEKNITIPYTQKVAINYTNNKQKVTFPIEINKDQIKGEYSFEVYCDKYYSGLKKLRLK